MNVVEIKNLSRVFSQRWKTATLLAFVFHACGAVGMIWLNSPRFSSATALNLCIMLVLLIWTQGEKNLAFYRTILTVFGFGMAVEMVGIHSGWLFGNYRYGKILGPQIWDVPVLIGINWFMTSFCIGTLICQFTKRWGRGDSQQAEKKFLSPMMLLRICMGAFLAMCFDLVMEKPAIRLGYWQWQGTGQPSWWNSFCWFVVSGILLVFFEKADFRKDNQFAVNLILIQFMFFLFIQNFL